MRSLFAMIGNRVYAQKNKGYLGKMSMDIIPQEV